MDGPERSLLRGMVASVLIAITVYAVTFPSLPALFPSELIAAELRNGDCVEPRVATTGYYEEPSLVFLLGTDTRFTDGAGAAEFLKQGACRFALIDARSERSFVQRADAIGLHYALSQRVNGYNISIGRTVMLTVFRSVEEPMSAAGETDPYARSAQLTLRRAARNAAASIAALARPVRTHTENPWPMTLQQIAAVGGVALLVFLLTMFLIDAAAIRGVGHLPRSIVWFFDQITDFGKSGWFLWPLGVLFLALAALPSLPRVPQLVLTAVTVRVGFLFAAIAVPGIFLNLVKHIFGRARPGVGGSLDPFLFSPFSLASLRQPAVRPCRHRVLGAGRVRHAVAARAHRVVGLCAGYRDKPGRGDRALPERRAGGRRGRRCRRSFGAALVRPAVLGLFGRRGRRFAPETGAFAQADQGRCARALV